MARVVEQQDDTVEEPLHTEDDVILCRTLDFHDDPHKLPALPPLPSFTTSTDIRSVYLVKITGLDNSLIGLTNAGHVLKINLEGGKISAWEYVSIVQPGWRVPLTDFIASIFLRTGQDQE